MKMNKEIMVAHIIDSEKGHDVVLNVGKKDGIKEGDKFLLYEIDPNPIIDPITKENLGNLELVKGRGEVTYVQEQICILTSTEKRSGALGSAAALIGETVPFDKPKIGDYAKKIN